MSLCGSSVREPGGGGGLLFWRSGRIWRGGLKWNLAGGSSARDLRRLWRRAPLSVGVRSLGTLERWLKGGSGNGASLSVKGTWTGDPLLRALKVT